ncbi:Acetyltransferase (GNAT) family protein [Chryseobacterium taichungense]|uniref:Acetyltransferase (GNAT) family protein n=1 Tax=Chryseobacterium taichungense TaxID=295069 RepID=A0A1H8BGR3_9FLAO|nr:GNAT family N-acetyltransferase [Chryseobacterium taichungense]SEM82045.1 Acetyltransferase (GNAT) family protein [Chryseobacterium taichungense]
MDGQVSSDLIEKWLKAWSLSRQLPLPVHYKSGLMVDVREEKQSKRYVFPTCNDDFFELAQTINEPWIFLKVCASFEEFKDKIPERWVLQPQGYMMYCSSPMEFADKNLPDKYRFEYKQYESTFLVNIMENNVVASSGRIVFVDDLAVYDRIFTEKDHRRKGLASFLMKELEKIALSKGFFNNFLVATEQGKKLYELLGWKLYSLYTSIVIERE